MNAVLQRSRKAEFPGAGCYEAAGARVMARTPTAAQYLSWPSQMPLHFPPAASSCSSSAASRVVSAASWTRQTRHPVQEHCNAVSQPRHQAPHNEAVEGRAHACSRTQKSLNWGGARTSRNSTSRWKRPTTECDMACACRPATCVSKIWGLVSGTERAVKLLANLYEALQLLWLDRNDSQRYVQLVEGHEALGQAGVFRPQRLYNCAQAAQSTSHSLIFRRRVPCLHSPSSARLRNAGFVMRRLTKCDAGSLAAPAAFAAAHSSLLDDSRAARAAPASIDTSWARYCKPLLFLT